MRFIILGFVLAVIGCGEKDKDPSVAKATLKFAENTGLALDESLVAFSLSLKSIQLVNDVNGKDATNVWLNPACTDSASCNATTTDYYDMIDIAAVNSVLNDEAKNFELRSDSEKAPESVTFKYVRFYICGSQTESEQKAIKWSAGSVTDGLTDSNFCVFDTAEMATPLTLTNNSIAVIELSYDLTGDRVYLGTEIEAGQTRESDYDTHYSICSVGSDDVQWCFDVPPIAAGVVVE